MKFKQKWAALRVSRKLCWLAIAALCLTLCAEVLSNFPALTTRGLTPVTIDPRQFVYESDATVTQDAQSIAITDAENRTVDLILQEPSLALHTVTVELGGQGSVNVAILYKDQASAKMLTQVYSTYCVPATPSLAVCYAPAQSAGTVTELRIRLKSLGAQPYAVTRITLNAPIPFQWQPIRLLLRFSLVLGLLCAAFLRGSRTAYDPANLAHKLILVLPLLTVMVFSGVVAQWIMPDTPLFTGITDEQATQSKTDSYAVLFETLRAGRLSVARQPDAALLAMQNPYDQSARTAAGISFPFDYSLYNGQYYLYYGVAPVISVYYPYHALTGQVPQSRDAALILTWLTIAFIGWSICGLSRRYTPDANVYALSLGCVTAVFASGAMFLLASADFYYLAEVSFVCFAAGAIAFGVRALAQPKRWLALGQYAFSGICFALAAASRPSALLMLFALLCPLFIHALYTRTAKAAQAIAFLVPAVAGVALLLWYNAARFGNVLDFGAAHQLTVTDVHYQRVRISELAPALYHYLLEPLSFTNRFPYLAVGYHALPAAGRYVFTLSNAGVLAYPIIWVLALFPLTTPHKGTRFVRERRWVSFAPLLVSLPLMLLSYGIGGAILRYTCDFRLFYTLPAIVCAIGVMSRPATPERKALAILCGALCVLSIAVGLGMVFDNERDNILKHSPQIYYGLQRMFFPY